MMPNDVAKSLPEPLCADTYALKRTGVFDDANTSVYVNAQNDFAFLHPSPQLDYSRYTPRAQSLSLEGYKKLHSVYNGRLQKIRPVLDAATSFLEIGASDGGFLAVLHEHFPDLRCAAVEPDENTKAARDALPWLVQFQTLEESRAFVPEVVGLFHVFEHLHRPEELLAEVHGVLARTGRLVIEVPALSDPLLSLYGAAAYEDFYFQRQHPYVYSAASLSRVVENNGFVVEQVIPYQRYGLENHLQWLAAGRPGGNIRFQEVFGGIESAYKGQLESSGLTDTVFVVARLR